MKAEYDILLVTDNLVIISDLGTGGRSIAKDARRVAKRMGRDISRLTCRRRIYYRNTDGRFGKILFRLNEYKGVRECSDSQQIYIDFLLNGGGGVGSEQLKCVSKKAGEKH